MGHGPLRQANPDGRGEIITFKSFVLLETEGPLIWEIAPHLARRVYEGRVRTLLDSYSPDEQADAERIVKMLLEGTLPKPSRDALEWTEPAKGKTGCRKRCGIPVVVTDESSNNES